MTSLKSSSRPIRTQECKTHGASDFSYDSNANRWRCKRCNSESVVKSRKKNKSDKKTHKQIKDSLLSEFGFKCTACGYNRSRRALHFHHYHSLDKRNNVSLMRSVMRAQEEFIKGTLLCANCHALHEYNENYPAIRNTPKTDVSTLPRIEKECPYHGMTHFAQSQREDKCLACTKDRACDRKRQVKHHLITHAKGKCQLCEQKYPNCVFHFHHMKPEEKLFSIASEINRNLSIILKEYAKCILLCGNCHAEVEDKMHIKSEIETLFRKQHETPCIPTRFGNTYWLKVKDITFFQKEYQEALRINTINTRLKEEADQKRASKKYYYRSQPVLRTCLSGHTLEKGKRVCLICTPQINCTCGKPINRKAILCISCSRKASERIQWPPMDELKAMLAESNYLQLGKKLGVSDNAIRKRIRNHG